MGKTFVWRQKIKVSEQLLSRRGTSAEGNNITSWGNKVNPKVRRHTLSLPTQHVKLVNAAR